MGAVVTMNAPKTRSSQAVVSDAEALELTRLAAQGDTSATATLLRVLAPEMLRVVRGVLGPSAADVDDAMQQGLIALIYALPSFRGECRPAGYACRIAFRTAMQVRRKARVGQLRHVSDPATTALAGAVEPEFPLAQRRTALVRRLLDELPAEQAEALALRSMLGWSLEEIAKASGAPLNTVRSRLRLAKEALRRAIEADPDLAEELGVKA
jgi:RNA polymerase sigma-70 factor (ECF subfamily)